MVTRVLFFLFGFAGRVGSSFFPRCQTGKEYFSKYSPFALRFFSRAGGAFPTQVVIPTFCCVFKVYDINGEPYKTFDMFPGSDKRVADACFYDSGLVVRTTLDPKMQLWVIKDVCAEFPETIQLLHDFRGHKPPASLCLIPPRHARSKQKKISGWSIFCRKKLDRFLFNFCAKMSEKCTVPCICENAHFLVFLY